MHWCTYAATVVYMSTVCKCSPTGQLYTSCIIYNTIPPYTIAIGIVSRMHIRWTLSDVTCNVLTELFLPMQIFVHGINYAGATWIRHHLKVTATIHNGTLSLTHWSNLQYTAFWSWREWKTYVYTCTQYCYSSILWLFQFYIRFQQYSFSKSDMCTDVLWWSTSLCNTATRDSIHILHHMQAFIAITHWKLKRMCGVEMDSKA